ncbi:MULTISPECIES: carbonic anhydrase family protein [unclassified Shinella]|uniref:carbonic anhydrase family protein n=1 Tax=unclassified Shinella TaxID=2643062 RepID=UPI001FD8FA66|nr:MULTISPECIES: carbonic anhydrase family protein [unclassified Shinella]
MTGFKLDERIRLPVELALTATSNDSFLFRKQEESARAIGMMGAEIDVARRGFSFDLKTSMAIALALAVREENRQRALAQACAREAARKSRRWPRHSGSRAPEPRSVSHEVLLPYPRHPYYRPQCWEVSRWIVGKQCGYS